MTSGNSLSHPKYRPDIDGLRAIAVMAVVGFHAFPNSVKGGFVGVDIFFVISGYLISTIIIGNLKTNSFSFAEFYARRVKRIFPALILVLAACFAFGWYALLSYEYTKLGKHIAGGATFISNFLLQNESGYFDTEATKKPLLHLWSLGVEEQFYILWPLLLWLAFRKKSIVPILILAIGGGSFAWNIISVTHHETGAFYAPQIRFWELMVGGMLAYLIAYPSPLLPKFIHHLKMGKTFSLNAASVIGCLLICWSIFWLNKNHNLPGWWALLPTLGAALLLGTPRALPNQLLLSNPFFVWIGLISYSLYLWHWPLLSFGWILSDGLPAQNIRIAAVLVSTVLAWLTYKFVETPIRRQPQSKKVAVALCVVMAIIGLTGYGCYKNGGFAFRNHAVNKISDAAGEFEFPTGYDQFTYQGRLMFLKKSERKETTLFIGDSNMEQYASRISELIRTKPSEVNTAVFAVKSGCLLIREAIEPISHDYCNGLLDEAYDYARENPNISTVVIGMQWYGDLSGETLWYYAENGNRYLITPGSEGYEKAIQSLIAYLKTVKALGKKVVLVLNVPVSLNLDPLHMIKRHFDNFHVQFEIEDKGVTLAALDEKYGQIKKDLIKAGQASGVTVLDPMDYLCDRQVCRGLDGDTPIYRDAAHLQPTWLRKRGTFLDFLMQPSR